MEMISPAAGEKEKREYKKKRDSSSLTVLCSTYAIISVRRATAPLVHTSVR